MRLIYITGFHRSGTTFMLNQLRLHEQCTGGAEEQGLHKLLETRWFSKWHRDGYDSVPLTGHALGDQLIEIGRYATHSFIHRGAGVIDGLAIGGLDQSKPNLVSKCPDHEFDEGLLSQYVDESNLFDDYRLVIMQRDEMANQRSIRKHFGFYNEDISRMRDLYDKMYRRTEWSDNARIVQYEKIPESLSMLSEFLGLEPELELFEEWRPSET